MIIITGNTRSGSSMIAGMIFQMDVFLGAWFHKRNKGNPQGYFEDIVPLKYNLDRYAKIITREQWQKGMVAFVERRQKKYGKAWGFKDPNLTYYLDDFIQLYPEAKVIIVNRKKEDVMKSIKKWMPFIKDQEQFYQEKQDIINDYKKPCLKINHENVLKNPEKAVNELIKYCGLSPTLLQRKKAEHFVLIDFPPGEVLYESSKLYY